MINTFLAERKIIKNNILSVETIQVKKKKNTNLRIIRIRIKGIQVSDNSSDEK
jgi:hypothetical protein